MKICCIWFPENHKENYKFIKQVFQNDKETIIMKNKKYVKKGISWSNVSVLLNATSVIDHSFIRSLTRDCQWKKRKWKSENARENVKEMAGKGW